MHKCSIQIEHVTSKLEWLNNTSLKDIAAESLPIDMKNLEEAIEFYSKNGIVSSAHLEKELNELKQKYEAAIGSK